MTAIPTLQTDRLILRPWREADLDGLATLYADGHDSRFIGGPLTREDSWRRLAMLVGHWSLRGYGNFALESKATGAFVGYCGPWYPFGFPEPEIGWGLLPSARGAGFATEAALCARAYAYDTLGWTTAISLVAPDNTPSIRVVERLGASLDGAADIRGRRCGIWRHPAPSLVPSRHHIDKKPGEPT